MSPMKGMSERRASRPTPCLVKGIQKRQSIVLAYLAK
jgi:hypothetical protein